MYVNSTADELLEDARSTSDKGVREEIFNKFVAEITKDVPAVFIYSPSFIYLVPEKVEALSLGQLTISGERFLNVHEWYIYTSKVWTIFNRN
jgi:peptide/nickel transport system substrate-binding protein